MVKEDYKIVRRTNTELHSIGENRYTLYRKSISTLFIWIRIDWSYSLNSVTAEVEARIRRKERLSNIEETVVYRSQ